MSETNTRTLVLASASPRRKQLLENLGLTFKVIPSVIDEPANTDYSPEEYTKVLAFNKANDVAGKLNFPSVIIGADTIVVINGHILGKPTSYEDAFKMLELLSGRSHNVITGIAVIDNVTQQTILYSVTSEVYFKNLSDDEISDYIKTGEPMDKAGAYAIQGLGSNFIANINGSYNNIVGLPTSRLLQILKDFQLDI